MKDKIYYHQIHPLKFLIDIVSSLIAFTFLWQGNTLMGLIVGLFPTFIISAILLFFTFPSFKRKVTLSQLHAYLSWKTQLVRTGGFILVAIGIEQKDYVLMLSGLFFLIPSWIWVIGLYLQTRHTTTQS